MVVCLCRDAVVASYLVLPETVDGLPDFVDGEGALFQLPPLGVVEDPREAVDFGLGVRVQCVLGGRVLPEKAVSGGWEHCGWVVGEGAVLLPDRGDGAVAAVGHGVAEVVDGLVGEFMLRIPLLFLGDAKPNNRARGQLASQVCYCHDTLMHSVRVVCFVRALGL